MKKLLLLLSFLLAFNAYSAVFVYGPGEATNLEPKIGFNVNDQKIVSNETADPSSSGYTAGEGSLLMRDTGELWLKNGVADTAWFKALFLDAEKKIPASHGSQILRTPYREFNHDGEASYSLVTNFGSGNNATFDGGGTLAGTLAIVATNTLNSTDSSLFRFTQAAGSLNDYFYHKQFEVDQNSTVNINFKYQYDGNDDDVEVEAKCVSSTTVYSVATLASATSTSDFSQSLFIPSNCGDLKLGFSVATLNSGAILDWNRVSVTDNPLTVPSSDIFIAVLTDEKSSGTAGGTFTSAGWRTRDLNNVYGDSSIVSLSSDQFVLGAGKYLISADAPAYNVDEHLIGIRNITSGSLLTPYGTVASSLSTGIVTNRSFVEVPVTLSASATFELQHYSNATRETDGFGRPGAFGVNEHYSKVKIMKLY